MSEIFRQKVLQATSIDEWLQQERQEKKHERFQQVDALLGNLLMRSLRGERIADILQQKHAEATVVVHGLTADEGTYVAQQYHLDRQQSRGAWFLPADASLKVGILSFPAYMQKNPRFATGLTLLERSRVPLKQTDALLVWALLEAFFEKVFQPFLLRGPLTGSQTREEHIQSWKDVDAFLATLGFSVSSELAVIRYGGGWSRLHSHEQLAAKQRLLAAFSAQARPDMAARYRISCISELVSQYYKKAGIDGKAKRKQVLTKPFERTLAGFFAGDWVAFLEYIDEEAHSDEQIITALPEIQIQVGGAKRASEVAAQFDLPTKEVEKMMAAYWGQSTSTSPIEQRVALLERYWPVFDNVHAKQQSGMLPLWGFAEDHLSFDFYHYFQSNIPYQSGLYQQILPHDMQLQIEQLWGTMMLRR